MRAGFQVLILGYLKGNENKYLIMERSDMGIWQFPSGGGENDESPEEAAIREMFEETGIKTEKVTRLETVNSVPASCFKAYDHLKDMYVIPEHIFATELEHEEVQLSSEHTAYKFMTFNECLKHLKYDSNKTALYEVNEKIKRKVL